MNAIVKTYESNGREITITDKDVSEYICAQASPKEVKLFLELCAAYGLNPFLKDAYLIKYDNSPATMVVGKDYYTKSAARNPKCKGYQAGVSVIDAQGGFHRRKGSMLIPGEQLIGAWAEVYVDGYEKPMFEEVSLSEYQASNQNWRQKPATMLRKVALVHALREAFPESFAGLYDGAEMGNEGAQAYEPPVYEQPPYEAEEQYEEAF